jgi:integral membrane protein
VNQFFNTQIGLFRTITFLEGISLILLVCIAVPIKYLAHNPKWVEILGPIHGMLFVGFCYMAYVAGKQYNWNWRKMAPKILLASFIPFGTFYFDHVVLKPLHLATKP